MSEIFKPQTETKEIPEDQYTIKPTSKVTQDDIINYTPRQRGRPKKQKSEEVTEKKPRGRPRVNPIKEKKSPGRPKKQEKDMLTKDPEHIRNYAREYYQRNAERLRMLKNINRQKNKMSKEITN